MPMTQTFKRHKPSNGVRAATHAATAEDYAKLAQHVVSALVNKSKDIVLKVPYFVQFSDDLPKGILIKKDAEYNWYRAKTQKLANWLYRHGHLSQDSKAIVKSMRTVVNMWGEIDRLLATPQEEFLKGAKILQNFAIVVDTEEKVWDNSTSEIKEG
jgi:hypothetical protein